MSNKLKLNRLKSLMPHKTLKVLAAGMQLSVKFVDNELIKLDFIGLFVFFHIKDRTAEIYRDEMVRKHFRRMEYFGPSVKTPVFIESVNEGLLYVIFAETVMGFNIGVSGRIRADYSYVAAVEAGFSQRELLQQRMPVGVMVRQPFAYQARLFRVRLQRHYRRVRNQRAGVFFGFEFSRGARENPVFITQRDVFKIGEKRIQ